MNELLRCHVTRTGFNLTLGKTQIMALDQLVQFGHKPFKDWGEERQVYGRSYFVPAVRGLITRGLVTHTPPMKGVHDQPAKTYYRITKAGWAVHTLLKEAGLV